MNEAVESGKPFALIVEDDPQLVTIFETAFQIGGFETDTAVDGRIAQTKLQTLVPDVILLDVHLPYVSGDDLLLSIRADTRFDQTQVILSTADSRVASQLRETASMVLLKPVSFKELVELAKSLQTRP